jgi:anti-anti-sigma factor
MQFVQAREGEIAVVRLAGRLDSSSAQAVEDSFAALLEGGVPQLAIDMSELEYISSAGLRVLLVVAKKMQQAQGRVALFGLLANVREVFAISGFDTIFAIQPDMAAAVTALR